MKKLVIVLALTASLIIVPAFAHSGGTDSSGGHYDRSTGEYHYHHGYSAHDHVNGVCPYDYDDKTGGNSGFSGSNYFSRTAYASTSSWYDKYTDTLADLHDAEQKLKSAEKELNAFKDNQSRNLALSAAVGLGVGFAALVIQVKRAQTRLEQTEKRLIDECERQVSAAETRVLSAWTKRMDEQQPDHIVAISNRNPCTAWYHRVQSPCIKAAGSDYKTVEVLDAYASGKEPCPFCKPMSIRAAEQWQLQHKSKVEVDRLQQQRRIESELQKAKAIEDQKAAQELYQRQKKLEQQRIDRSVQFDKEMREYRAFAENVMRCESITNAMKEKGEPDLSDGVVYISRYGSDAYYHHWKECSRTKEPILVSKQRATAIGFSPCKCCGKVGQPEYDVYVDISVNSGAKCYHRHLSWCLTFDKTIPLEKAIEEGYKPCERCNPPKSQERVWF